MSENIKMEKIIIYLFTAIVSFAVYIFLTTDIRITLIPHISAIKLLYPMQFEFIPGTGYREAGGLFIIGESCIGAKLFICLFLILYYRRRGKRPRTQNKRISERHSIKPPGGAGYISISECWRNYHLRWESKKSQKKSILLFQ